MLLRVPQLSSRSLIPGILLLGLLGCSSPAKTWTEEGVVQGKVRVSRYEGGELHEYLDHLRRVVRIEHRGVDGELDPRFHIELFEYDSSGRSLAQRFEDGSGNAVIGPLGFAARRTRRETGERGESLTHHEHFDASDLPLLIPAGYFRETLEHSGRRLKSRRFFDLDSGRVSVKVDDFDRVHEVRYAHLKGATPIVMEMYVDKGGTPLHKRKISGHTTRRVDHWFSAYTDYSSYNTYGSYGYYPLYSGTTVTYSSTSEN